jgi:hypothetical protein
MVPTDELRASRRGLKALRHRVIPWTLGATRAQHNRRIDKLLRQPTVGAIYSQKLFHRRGAMPLGAIRIHHELVPIVRWGRTNRLFRHAQQVVVALICSTCLWFTIQHPMRRESCRPI